MASKRELLELDDGEISEPGPKRAKKQTGATPRHQHQNSSIDPTWGQKYVFSNLEDTTTIPYGDESDFEDDFDAMAYLQSVRKEACGIPHLLVAPKVQIGPQLPPELQSDYDRDEGEIEQGCEALSMVCTKEVMQGYYDDGAYVAMPDEDWSGPGEDVDAFDHHLELDSDAEHDARIDILHKAYSSSILRQYRRLRQLLHSKCPTDAAKQLSSTQLTHAAPFNRNSNTNKVWANLIRNTDPHPLQLAMMSKDTVIRIVRVLIGGTFLRRGHTLTERTSQWIWGLLARLPDRGELNHTEIGWIRDLGRRAVLLGRSLAEMAMLREQLAEGELGVNEGFDASNSDEEELAADCDGDLEDQEAVSSDDNSTEEDQQVVGIVHSQLVDPPGHANGCADEHVENGSVYQSSAIEDDIAMDLESGSEDGEAKDEQDLEAARRALLARLSEVPGAEEQEPETAVQEEARLRLRMNMRATLMMILTVAGEFYGQRDLLEFRTPFIGL